MLIGWRGRWRMVWSANAEERGTKESGEVWLDGGKGASVAG